MKNFITLLAIVFISSISFSQVKGFCFSTSHRGDFEDVSVEDFDRIKTKTEQTNIYSFSFVDSMLVHLILRDDEVICQYYKITDVEELQKDAYVINCLSGLSGIYYVYYLTNYNDELEFYQIYDSNDKNEMSGTRFSGFGEIQLNTYVQL